MVSHRSFISSFPRIVSDIQIQEHKSSDNRINHFHDSYHSNKTTNQQIELTAPPENNNSLIISPKGMEAMGAVIGVNNANIMLQTVTIRNAFQQLRSSMISRLLQYSGNTLASRRGYVAENYIAGSYNLDAAIKKIPDRAIVPGDNGPGSPDIIYDYGKKQAGLKFYDNAKAGAKAQLDPKYGNQDRVVPADQLEEAKAELKRLAEWNQKRGREGTANQQNRVKELLTDKIKGNEGAEAKPLSKDQADEFAKAAGKDENGNSYVDREKIDEVLSKTGETQKARNAIIKNELKGLAASVAIGLGTAFSIGFVVHLAQNGLSPSSIKYAFIAGAKSGVEGAFIAGASHILGRTIGNTLSHKLSEVIISKLTESAAETTLKNISTMCTMGVVGSITIIALSIYQFTKLKLAGFSTKECLIRTVKSAALSFAVLVLSIIAQGIWGGPAGMIVSIIAGVLISGYSVCKSIHEKKMFETLKIYIVLLNYPSLT